MYNVTAILIWLPSMLLLHKYVALCYFVVPLLFAQTKLTYDLDAVFHRYTSTHGKLTSGWR